MTCQRWDPSPRFDRNGSFPRGIKISPWSHHESRCEWFNQVLTGLQLLDTWNTREQGLIDSVGECCPAVAFPPEPKGAYIGQDLSPDVKEKIEKEGARTIPGVRPPILLNR